LVLCLRPKRHLGKGIMYLGGLPVSPFLFFIFSLSF
jgi:hypothetical protein